MASTRTLATAQPADTKWSSFLESPEWCALSPQRKIFVVAFLATKNAQFATKCSHPNVNQKVLRQMSYQNRHSRKVQAALATFDGRTDRDDFLDELKATIEASTGIAKADLMRLYANLRFGSNDAPETPDADAALLPPRRKSAAAFQPGAPAETPAHVFKIGDPVRVDGQLRRVLAVDENGRPTEVSDEVIS